MNQDARLPVNKRAADLAEAIARFLVAAPALRDPQVMARVASFLSTCGSLLTLVARSGFILRNFHTTAALEFYADVYQRSKDLGSVSKGWNDPGFRVLDMLYIHHAFLPTFKARIYEIVEACASQGCCFQIHRSQARGIRLELWTPLYGDQLHPGALKEAFRALAECRRRIGRVCAFSRTPPTRRSRR